MEDNYKREDYLNDDEVNIESFKKYENSDDGFTKKVDGNLKIESFRLYKSEDEVEENNEH